MKKLIKKLSEAFAPSGFTKEARDIIVNEIGKENVSFDKMGAVYAHVENKDKPKIVISAHMDEVGMMATYITDDGLICFSCVGGIDPSVLLSKRVVHESGIKGSIVSKPIHLLSKSERETFANEEDMRIDIGAKDKEDAEKYISLGDYFTFDSDFVEFGDGFIKCKALDDRIGCAVMCKLYKEITEKNLKTNYDIYFAFTDREELGYSGSFGMAEKLKPDYAIVIESTAVADIHGVAENKRVATLGNGGAISFADRATVYDEEFENQVIVKCEKNNIRYQIKKFVSGGNDASHIQVSAGGCKVVAISAPSRYIHSPSDVCKFEDIENIYNAVRAVLCEG